MYEYESYDLSEAESYSGIAKDIYKEHNLMNTNFNNGNMEILDRLTKCLKTAKRYDEMKETVQDYLKRFPNASNRSVMKQILKRLRSLSKFLCK